MIFATRLSRRIFVAVACTGLCTYICSAITASDTTAQKSQLEELQKQAVELAGKERYSEAADVTIKIIALRKSLVEENNEELTGAYGQLGYLLEKAGEFEKAIETRRIHLQRLARQHGEDYWVCTNVRLIIESMERQKKLTADELAALRDTDRSQVDVDKLRGEGRYHEAVALQEKIVEVRTRLLGDRDREALTAVGNLGVLYGQQGDRKRSEAIARRQVDLEREVFGRNHPSYASSLNNLATRYSDEGNYKLAEPLLRESLDVYRKLFGEEHPRFLGVLSNLAVLLQRKGDFGGSEPLYLRAVDLSRRMFGENHRAYARCLNDIGFLYAAQERWSDAEQYYRLSCDAYKRSLGEQHPDYAIALANLSGLLESMGEIEQAESLIRQSLDIDRAVLGPHHPDVYRFENSLALLLSKQGDYSSAKRMFDDLAKRGPELLGKKSLLYAAVLKNLGWVEYKLQNYRNAEARYRQAQEIHAAIQGTQHPDMLFVLNDLAVLLEHEGRFAEAIAVYDDALAIHKATGTESGRGYGIILHNLAFLREAQGDYAAAEKLSRQANAFLAESLGRGHPDLATGLTNIAVLQSLQGRAGDAIPIAREAVEIQLGFLNRTAAIQSERQQMLALAEANSALISFLSVARIAHKDPWDLVVAWKGAVTTRQIRQRTARAILAQGPDTPASKLYRELEARSRELGASYAKVPSPSERLAYQQRLTTLADEVERLQRDLSRQVKDLSIAERQTSRTAAEVRAALPSNTALVDLLEASIRVPTVPAADGKFGPPQWERKLLAFIVHPDRSETITVDLGSPSNVALALDAWRDDLGATEGTAAAAAPSEIPAELRADLTGDPAKLVRRLVWEPLVPHLEGIDLILLSPDGVLGQLPWGALPGNDPEKYLVEERTLAVIPVPQALPDLVSRPAGQATNMPPSLLVMGGIDYDAEPGVSPPTGESTTIPQLAKSRSAPRGSGRGWKRLAATTREMAQVQQLFQTAHADGTVDRLEGAAANEDSVRRRFSRHQYLHLATHGYFAPPQFLAAGRSDRSSGGALLEDRQQIVGLHPGLLSGLVLAGANRPVRANNDDGVLTALEVGELDLTDTQLAVLSACQTGLGQSAGGEGLLGLQRAFQVAGCRTVVSSLWNVNDSATEALMVEFYRALWSQQGVSRVQALRQAQLRLLREGAKMQLQLDPAWTADEQGRLPPRYWAAFVLSGDWR